MPSLFQEQRGLMVGLFNVTLPAAEDRQAFVLSTSASSGSTSNINSNINRNSDRSSPVPQQEQQDKQQQSKDAQYFSTMLAQLSRSQKVLHQVLLQAAPTPTALAKGTMAAVSTSTLTWILESCGTTTADLKLWPSAGVGLNPSETGHGVIPMNVSRDLVAQCVVSQRVLIQASAP